MLYLSRLDGIGLRWIDESSQKWEDSKIPRLCKGLAMWEKFLLSIGMKVVDHLTKKGLISIDKEQTRQNIRAEISHMMSGKAPPENINEILLFANNELGPFDDDVKSLHRITTSYKQTVARKGGARKTVAAKKRPAAKKKPAAKKRAA